MKQSHDPEEQCTNEELMAYGGFRARVFDCRYTLRAPGQPPWEQGVHAYDVAMSLRSARSFGLEVDVYCDDSTLRKLTDAEVPILEALER